MLSFSPPHPSVIHALHIRPHLQYPLPEPLRNSHHLSCHRWRGVPIVLGGVTALPVVFTVRSPGRWSRGCGYPAVGDVNDQGHCAGCHWCVVDKGQQDVGGNFGAGSAGFGISYPNPVPNSSSSPQESEILAVCASEYCIFFCLIRRADGPFKVYARRLRCKT